MTKYYENGDVTTKVEYVYSGTGINAQSVYAKIITTFTIADGVIIDNRYVPCKCFCR